MALAHDLHDVAHTADELKRISTADASSYLEFARSFGRIGQRPYAAPDDDSADNRETGDGRMWNLGKLGLSFRGLPSRTRFACCGGDRWPLRISLLSGLKRNRCARLRLRAVSRVHLPAPGQRAPAPEC